MELCWTLHDERRHWWGQIENHVHFQDGRGWAIRGQETFWPSSSILLRRSRLVNNNNNDRGCDDNGVCGSAAGAVEEEAAAAAWAAEDLVLSIVSTTWDLHVTLVGMDELINVFGGHHHRDLLWRQLITCIHSQNPTTRRRHHCKTGLGGGRRKGKNQTWKMLTCLRLGSWLPQGVHNIVLIRARNCLHADNPHHHWVSQQL